MGRPVDMARRKERQRLFLAAYQEIGTLAGASKQSGVAVNQHHQWVKIDPEYAAQILVISEATAEKRQAKITHRDPGYKRDRSAEMTARWADPEFRAKRAAAMTPEVKAKISESVKKAWAEIPAEQRSAHAARATEAGHNPESIARRGAGMKRRWADPEFREKMAKINSSPEAQGKRSASVRNSWAKLTPEERNARMAKIRRVFKGGHMITKIEADTIMRLNECEYDGIPLGYCTHRSIPGTDFIADLLIPSHNLIIECDGEYQHAQRPEHDANRDAVLTELGYKLLRLSEAEIKAGDWRRLDEALQI
jgi:very-short-patch-repair endonuclease